MPFACTYQRLFLHFRSTKGGTTLTFQGQGAPHVRLCSQLHELSFMRICKECRLGAVHRP